MPTRSSPGHERTASSTEVLEFWFDERVRPLLFASTPALDREVRERFTESIADQDRAVSLYERAGLTDGLRWARHHRDVVRRFGRFPHRNATLGHQSTEEERGWLASAAGHHG